MPAYNVTITNLPEIRVALAKSPRLMVEQLNLAIKKTIFNIQRRSMINTPVDTGRLRASTKSQFSNLRGEVGTNTSYDVFVHEGTRFMKARPYLSNAINETNVDTEHNFKVAVQNVLDEIARGV